MPGETGYFAADADAQDELARLRLLENEFDPWTFRYLDTIGVGAGWRCLEIGAGAGSVVRWLSERVGADGLVVAADIDPKFLGDPHEPNTQVRRCDITRDELEADFYDVVHCRLLLMHMSDPAAVLRRMVTSLRPGGWLLAEDGDSGIFGALDFAHPLAELFDSCFRKRVEFLSSAGIVNMRFGMVLPMYVEALGLVEIGNEGVARVYRGGDSYSRLGVQSWQRTDDMMIAKGVLTESKWQACGAPTWIRHSPTVGC